MSIKSILLKLILLFLPCQLFCLNLLLEPVRFEAQQEIYVQGGLSLLSEKQNSVLFYPTNERLSHGRANFYFIITNRTGRYLNFLTHHLRVTDQFGRPVRVVPVEELISQVESDAKWNSFFNFVGGGLDLLCAQNAGRIDYARSSHRHSFGHSHSYHSTRPFYHYHHHHHYDHHEDLYEHGTYHCEALRRAAEREALINTSLRAQAINDAYEMRLFKYRNFYLSSNTIYPNDVYSANFQITIPKFMLVDLQCLFFTFDLEGETHTFSVYCSP